jgi:hypothetical protein
MKEIKMDSQWECEHCGTKLRTKQACIDHELECKVEIDLREKYKDRVKSFDLEGIHVGNLFYAQSMDDVQALLDSGWLSWSFNDESELPFPCHVIQVWQHEHYWDYGYEMDEDNYYVYELEDYIGRLRDAAEEL